MRQGHRGPHSHAQPTHGPLKKGRAGGGHSCLQGNKEKMTWHLPHVKALHIVQLDVTWSCGALKKEKMCEAHWRMQKMCEANNTEKTPRGFWAKEDETICMDPGEGPPVLTHTVTTPGPAPEPNCSTCRAWGAGGWEQGWKLQVCVTPLAALWMHSSFISTNTGGTLRTSGTPVTQCPRRTSSLPTA